MSLINKNRSQHLNPKFNDWITDCVNVLQRRLTLKERKFLRRCYTINVLSGIPLCFNDFKGVLGIKYKGNFRAIKHKLSSLFEVTCKGKPTYYKLRGLYLDKELTNQYTSIPISERIFANLNILLSLCRHEIPQLHAILFKCNTFELYSRLVELGYSPNEKKAITINEIPVHKIITASITIYSNGTMLVRLGCTYFPIDYNDKGWIEVIEILSNIKYYLRIITNKDFQIEPIGNWKLKHIDLNRDSITYDFPTDECAIHMIFGHIQVYNKKFPDGTKRIRVEEQLELDETISTHISSDTYQKASELLKDENGVEDDNVKNID